MNKPQFLMSIMRNFKDRVRQLGAAEAVKQALIPGPQLEKIKEIMDRTGYRLEVTVGQRKYHVPTTFEGPEPTHGHEVSFRASCLPFA